MDLLNCVHFIRCRFVAAICAINSSNQPVYIYQNFLALLT